MPWTPGRRPRGGPPASSARRPAQSQRPGDVVPLDVVGAGEDPGGQGVPQEGLRLPGDHSQPAPYLHGVQAELDGGLAHRELGEGRRDLVLAASRQLPRGPVQQGPGALQTQGHVDDPMADRLESADGRAELLPLPGVARRGVEDAAHRAQVDREQADALPLHRRGEHGGSRALRAEHLARRHLAAVEVDVGRGRSAQAELVVGGADPEPRGAGLDQERRQPEEAAARFGRRLDEEDVGDGRVRREALGAVEDVRVALAFGAGAQTECVGPGLGFGDAVRRDPLPEQSAGSQARFCSSVPNSVIGISEANRWAATEKAKPVSSVPRPSASMTAEAVTASRPLPP